MLILSCEPSEFACCGGHASCALFFKSVSALRVVMGVVATGAAIIIRGQYYAPGQTVPPDDSKLFLLIEGPTMQVVKRAKELIKQIIEERTERSMRRDTGAMGRTSVV